jgi:peptidyl-prolyl cis-trans isomerase C
MRGLAPLLAAPLLASGLALAQPAPAPAPTPAPAGNPVVARVEGVEIRLNEVQDEVRRLPDELRGMPPGMLLPLLLDQMITQKAIIAAARTAGLDREPEVQARIRRAEEEALQQALLTREIAPQLTEEALRARYGREVANRPAEEEVRARHILVANEADARTALAEARRPGADFAEIARRRSSGPGSREGGDLGFFKRGDMIPEFAEAPSRCVPARSARPGAHPVRLARHQGGGASRLPRAVFEDSRENLRQQAFEEGVNAASSASAPPRGSSASTSTAACRAARPHPPRQRHPAPSVADRPFSLPASGGRVGVGKKTAAPLSFHP